MIIPKTTIECVHYLAGYKYFCQWLIKYHHKYGVGSNLTTAESKGRAQNLKEGQKATSRDHPLHCGDTSPIHTIRQMDHGQTSAGWLSLHERPPLT